MSDDPRLATLGDGGISEKAKEFAKTLPDDLSYNARNMLADFVTRSNASGTYVENWLGHIATELVEKGYMTPLEGVALMYDAPDAPYTLYSYTDKIAALRKAIL